MLGKGRLHCDNGVRRAAGPAAAASAARYRLGGEAVFDFRCVPVCDFLVVFCTPSVRLFDLCSLHWHVSFVLLAVPATRRREFVCLSRVCALGFDRREHACDERL